MIESMLSMLILTLLDDTLSMLSMLGILTEWDSAKRGEQICRGMFNGVWKMGKDGLREYSDTAF